MDIGDLTTIYEEYDRAYAKAVAEAPACGGLLGMGDSPKNAACHEAFYEKVGAWTAAFLAEGPSAEAAEAALSVILKAADARRDRGTYWYCYAAQGHGAGLVGLLSREDAAALSAWYEGAYPAIGRMPVQKNIAKLLKKQAKKATGFFR